MRIVWCAIIALAVGLGVLTWQLERFISNAHQVEMTQTIQTQSAQISALTDAMKKHDAQFQQIADHSNQLLEAVKNVDREMREGNPQWRYAQMQYYIERAAQETYVMKDPVLAKTWLETALQSSLKLKQANLLPVQEALQKDIQDLSQQGGNAATQAMLSLSALSDSVSTMPHKQATDKIESSESDTTETDEAQDWHVALMTGWNQLKSLVRVRTVNGEVVPYFSSNEKSMIDQNVSLMLTQASFSAMRGNQYLYAHNIAQAIYWINRYYDSTTPQVQEALNTLNHLSIFKVNYVPPTRLKSVDALSGFMQQSGKSS